MSGRCPQDGGFIGEAGCTHPNHRHSDLVRGLLEGEPKTISAGDAEAALREGFYARNPEGRLVGFGERLLSHIDDHNKGDADARKTRLKFAVRAVTNPDRVEKNHRGLEGRTLYTKAFDRFGMLVVSGRGGDLIEQVFTIFPNREGKRRKG